MPQATQNLQAYIMAIEYVFDDCETQSGSTALTRTSRVDAVESFR